MGHEQPNAGPLARRDDRLGVLDRSGERLFADDVPAGRGRADGDVGVLVRRRADVDHIDRSKQFLEGRRHPGPESPGEGVGPRRVVIA